MARSYVPSIAPRSFVSSEGVNRRGFTSRMNRALPNVRARQAGGYEDVGIPNPNSAMALRGLYQSSGSPTHLAGGMSASEYNARSAARVNEQREALQREAQSAGGLRSVVQGLSTVPVDKRWDAFFGGLQNVGADQLETGAATGMDMGPSVYDMKTGTSYQQARPGFFDTQVGRQQRAYDPRDARAGGPDDSPFVEQQEQMRNATRQAIGGLIGGMPTPYNPHAGSPFRRR